MLLTSAAILCMDAAERSYVMSMSSVSKALSKDCICFLLSSSFLAGALIVTQCCMRIKYRKLKNSVPVRFHNIVFTASVISSFSPENQKLLRTIQMNILNILFLHESYEKLQADFNSIYSKNLKQEDIDKLEACSYISCELKEKLYTQEEEKKLEEEMFLLCNKMDPLLDFVLTQMKHEILVVDTHQT